jgi:hypothetical protein
MKRDMSVTVTRDIRVTSQVPRHCDIGCTSRVSHATTTTPHHTMSVVTSVDGLCGYVQIQVQSVRASGDWLWRRAR